MFRGSLAVCSIVGTVVLCCLLIGATGQDDGLERIGVDQSKGKAIRLDSNISFAKGGTQELKLDLAMSMEGEGPFPAIICLHSGGWVGGERQQMKGTIEALARHGYVAVSPDYRPAPRDRFPAQVEDCKAAVRWLRANSQKYSINPERIGVFGFSAGGHLACMLGVTGKEDGLEGEGGNAEQSSAVQAVVSFFGPTDFTQPVWSKDVRERHLTPFLGGTAEEKAEVYRRASPMTYVSKNAPPFLFVHGTADDMVPMQQSEEMVKKLRQLAVPARLIAVDGEGHGWGWSQEDRLKSLAHMMDFFDENLKK
ncbi:MAG TPA: alpha/beta hydrolase [Gemmataceae bacterium]